MCARRRIFLLHDCVTVITRNNRCQVCVALFIIATDDLMTPHNPLDDVTPGLQSDQPIPLRSVHVRAKLLDLAAEVVSQASLLNQPLCRSLRLKLIPDHPSPPAIEGHYSMCLYEQY